MGFDSHLAVIDLDERIDIEPQTLRARAGEEQMKASGSIGRLD